MRRNHQYGSPSQSLQYFFIATQPLQTFHLFGKCYYYYLDVMNSWLHCFTPHSSIDGFNHLIRLFMSFFAHNASEPSSFFRILRSTFETTRRHPPSFPPFFSRGCIGSPVPYRPAFLHSSLLKVRSRKRRRRAVSNPRPHPRSKIDALESSATVGRPHSSQ